MSKGQNAEVNKLWDNPQSVKTNQLHIEQQYSAEGLLEDGIKVLTERGKQYDPEGKAERSMVKIVQAFAIITGKVLTEAEGWEFMAILKQVRQFQRPGFHADSAQDFVNYAALCGEAKAKETVDTGSEMAKKFQKAINQVRKSNIQQHYEKMAEEVKEEQEKKTVKLESLCEKSYLARQLSNKALEELREEAYARYKTAALLLDLPHAASWIDMHPKEQEGWVARVIKNSLSSPPSALIIDPATRKKDPTTGLDCPICD